MRPVPVSGLLAVLACLTPGVADLLTSGSALAASWTDETGIPAASSSTAGPFVSGPSARVFCAEAIWCRMVQDLGGSSVTVMSVLSTPQTDPHDFQVTPETARQLAGADLVIMTGGHYDDWMRPLLAAQDRSGRELIDIASLMRLGPGQNPHVFDDPQVMRLAIDRVASWLDRRFPDRHTQLALSRTRNEAFCNALTARLEALRPRVQGKMIAIAEPVGGPLFAALGLTVIDMDFALATMGHSDPAPQDVARLEDVLRARTVSAFIVNPAMQTPALIRLADLARRSGVPVVSLDEFPAPDRAWKDWVADRIERLAAVLGGHE